MSCVSTPNRHRPARDGVPSDFERQVLGLVGWLKGQWDCPVVLCSTATERDDGLVHYDAPEHLAFGDDASGGTWWSCLVCGGGGVGSDLERAGDLAMNHVLTKHPEAGPS